MSRESHLSSPKFLVWGTLAPSRPLMDEAEVMKFLQLEWTRVGVVVTDDALDQLEHAKKCWYDFCRYSDKGDVFVYRGVTALRVGSVSIVEG